MDATRQDALQTLNAGRRAVGLDTALADFPKGLRDDPQHCPVAQALEEVAQALGAEGGVSVDLAQAEFYAGVGPRLEKGAAKRMARLAGAWGEVWWDVRPDEADISLPDTLRAFVKAFDAGEYPDLDEARTPCVGCGQIEDHAHGCFSVGAS